MVSKIQHLVQHNVALAPMTSWHIGGMAEYFAQPSNLNELSHLVNAYQNVPITWLGLGSNILIRDKGIRGLVICTRGLNQLQMDDTEVQVEAGVACAKMARFCQKQALSGASFFIGIPGTIGGALQMNAGAFGGTTWNCVSSVRIMDNSGQIIKKYPTDFEIKYRHTKALFSHFLGFVSVRFCFSEGKQLSSDLKEDIRLLLQKRQATQPIGTFNCGSVYRNPVGDHAARLIEACGFKGKLIDGAMVSTKHANFIINTGHATAKAVEALMLEIENAVWERFSIKLEREVKVLGE